MSSIVKHKVGKYTYLYESISFRNEDGQPRNKRITIGRIDPITGQPIYKPEYLERMVKAGTPVDINLSFTKSDILSPLLRILVHFIFINHLL